MHTVEEILRQAVERGEFQNLPGQGKKLDLDEYFCTPEDRRVAYALLKSNGFVPEEVQLLKEVEVLQEQLRHTTNEEEQKQIRQEIEIRRLKYNLRMERLHRR